MNTFIADLRVAEMKVERAQEKARQDQKAVREERPAVLRSFDEIYRSDQFTLEAAIKAFAKP